MLPWSRSCLDPLATGLDGRLLEVEVDLLDNLTFENQGQGVMIRDGALGVVGASMGGAVAVEIARRQPDRINTLLLLAPAGLTGRPMPVPPLLDRLGAWFLSRPGVRRGLCRQAFADPDRDVGPAEEQIASLHLQCPGWSEALAAFARSGGFSGSGQPLPQQPMHVLWGNNDRILRAGQKQALSALLEHPVEGLDACGHLPHIDRPRDVSERCNTVFLPG